MMDSPAYLFVRQDTSGAEIRAQLALSADDPPLLFLIAGAKDAGSSNLGSIHSCIQQAAAAAKSLNAVVVDGGTDYGPMGMLNRALAENDFPGAYIGFLPAFSARTVYEVDRSNLGNAHSHFVLVEGDEYGDERVPMFNLFASFRRAAGLVVNGGPRAADEVRTAVGLGLPLVVVEGSGQLADELAQPTQAGEILTPAQAAALRNEGKFVFVDGETKAGTIGKVLEALFSF